jgi:hypothetical protein
MKAKTTLLLVALSLAGANLDAQNLIAPGTPCADIGVPTGPCTASPSTGPSSAVAIQALFDLIFDPGDNNLGVFVVPGDVVLFEHPPVGSLVNPVPSTWSDVVHFQNIPGVFGSTATLFADGETGVLLPVGFTLSANAVGIVETQTGTGTDADFTLYTAGSNTYQVHSDAALTPEPPEPGEGVPEPATSLLIGGGLAIAGGYTQFRSRQRK